MAYRNEATDRARLRRQFIDAENKPCAINGCDTQFDRREIHRIKNGNAGGRYTERNTIVLCFNHHRREHPNSKFWVGDKVRLHRLDAKHPVPSDLGFTAYELTRPRTIVRIRYDAVKQCNFYTLGSNGRGKTRDGQPLEGIRYYEFRSYQLIPYEPRSYHFKRAYKRAKTTGTATPHNQNLANQRPKIPTLPTCQPLHQSQENEGK